MAIVFPSGTLSGPTKILQVLTKFESTATAENIGPNSDGTTKVLSITITPSSTSSKILVMYTLNVSANYSFASTILRRGTTKISVGTSTGSRTPTTTYELYSDTNSQSQAHTAMFLDSPSSTSALDYNVIISNTNNGTNTFYTNRTPNDSNSNVLRNRTASSIIVMEVSA